MFRAHVVFRDAEGTIVPRDQINQLPHHEFFSKWGRGELRRDFEIIFKEDKGKIGEYLKEGPKSPNFHLVGVEIYGSFRELDFSLSLADKVFTIMRGGDGTVDRVNMRGKLDPREVTYSQEVDEVNRITLKNGDYYFPHYYWLDANVVHGPEWFQRDPEEVIREAIIEMLEQWTQRDNATVLMLLQNASKVFHEEEHVIFKDLFSPAVLSALMTTVTRWAIPTTSLVTTAEALGKIGTEEDWHSSVYLDNQPELLPAIDHGTLFADVQVFVIGSPYDVIYPLEDGQPDMYLCGKPHHLGVRAIKVDGRAEIVDKSILGSLEQGWNWATYIGTGVVNSRAVVTAELYRGDQ